MELFKKQCQAPDTWSSSGSVITGLILFIGSNLYYSPIEWLPSLSTGGFSHRAIYIRTCTWLWIFRSVEFIQSKDLRIYTFYDLSQRRAIGCLSGRSCAGQNRSSVVLAQAMEGWKEELIRRHRLLNIQCDRWKQEIGEDEKDGEVGIDS